MKKLSILLLLSLVLTTSSLAQVSKVGTAGVQFLKIWAEPRGTAMGGAYTAVVDDATGLYWNPAGVSWVARPTLIVSDVEWLYDVRNNFLGYVIPHDVGNIGISLTVLSMGKEEITTLEQPNGTGEEWGAMSIAAGLTYSRWFTREFAFGGTAKYVYESILDATSSGVLFDFGVLLYPRVWGSLRAGFVMSNFGPDMSFHGGPLIENLWRDDWVSGQGPVEVELQSAAYPPPLLLKFGLAFDPVYTPDHKLTVAADLSHPNDGSEKIHLGAEYTWASLISFRSGFRYDPNLWDDRDTSTEGLTFGVGMKYPMGNQFYSFSYAGEDRGYLGLKHRFCLGIEF